MFARWKVAVFVGAIAVGLAVALAPYWTAAALIVRAADLGGWPGTLARWGAEEIDETIVRLHTRAGDIRGRVFRPARVSRGSALLVSGVHPDGIDDDRLIKLARELAATGTVVVTPEIVDLLHYELTPRVTDTIEDAALWMLDRPDAFSAGRVGLIGVSFSGGLTTVAAGRPALRDRVAYVVSFGGHGSLPRVLEFLSTGDGEQQPHDYSVAIVLHQAADLIVPAGQVAALRRAIETFLAASALYRTSPAEADRRFAEARALEHELPEPSASLLHLVNNRDVVQLGLRLRPVVSSLGQHPSLSPERSPPPAAPVYLLHGADDTVIPATEAVRLAAHLDGQTEVHLLVSRFLTHVDVASSPGIRETWNMIDFWKGVLSEY